MHHFLRISVFLFLLLNFVTVKGEAAMIEKGKKVKFDYVLKVEGEVVDSSDKQGPLEYVHGDKMIIPGLESELEGMKVGDEKKVTVSPENAYGNIDERAFVEFPKNSFAAEVDPKAGMIIQVPTKDGRQMPAVIAEVKEEVVVLDFNHPLAGKELNFEVTIVSIE